MIEDLRREQRVPVVYQVSFRAHDALGLARNLSRSGICVASSAQCPVGDRTMLELHLPGFPAPVSLCADVMWARTTRRGPELGLRFVYSSEAQRTLVAALVEKNVDRTPLLS